MINKKIVLTTLAILTLMVTLPAKASCSMSTVDVAKCQFGGDGSDSSMKIVTLTNNSDCELDSIWYQRSGVETKSNGAVDHGTYTVYRFDELRLVISNKSLMDLENGAENSLQVSRTAKLYQTSKNSKKLIPLQTIQCDAISIN